MNDSLTTQDVLLNTQQMHNYKKLNAWQEAVTLVVEVYKVTQAFPAAERFNLTSQINRSAVSIPSNIAEGAGRNTDGEFNQFLGIASGSCYELETQLIIAQKLGYLSEETLTVLSNRTDHIQKMIYNLQRRL